MNITPALAAASEQNVKKIEEAVVCVHYTDTISKNIKGFICQEDKKPFAFSMAIVFGEKYGITLADAKKLADYFLTITENLFCMSVSEFRKEYLYNMKRYNSVQEVMDYYISNGFGDNAVEGEDYVTTSKGVFTL